MLTTAQITNFLNNQLDYAANSYTLVPIIIGEFSLIAHPNTIIENELINYSDDGIAADELMKHLNDYGYMFVNYNANVIKITRND